MSVIIQAALSLAIVFGLAAQSLAGLNPADPGLPNAQAYGYTYDNTNSGGRLIGHRASSMCVDCHTANPKPGSGTHYVVHNDGGGVRGISDRAKFKKIDAWSGGASFLSRYGAWPGGVETNKGDLISADSADPDFDNASPWELICESCHNLVRNGPGGNNLLESFRSQDDPTVLCEGCHPTQSGGPPAHHALTGDTVGGDDENAAPHVLSTAHASHVRATPLAGSDVAYPAANAVNCASCHVPHGAEVATGARVLRRGYAVTALPWTDPWAAPPVDVVGAPENVIYNDDVPVLGDVRGDIKIWDTGDTVIGIDRNVDVINAYGMNLVFNRDPLCDACHNYNE